MKRRAYNRNKTYRYGTYVSRDYIWRNLFFASVCVMLPLLSYFIGHGGQKELVSPLVSGVVYAYEGVSEASKPVIIEDSPMVVSSYTGIDKLVADTFPEDPETAIAVMMSESSGVADKTLIADAGHYFWSSPTYKGECSIGLFMINLASDGCKGDKVHYDAVPGNTLEEKIEWLKVPENNISMARDIYDERGNWTAWSGYTGGGYKKHLGNN